MVAQAGRIDMVLPIRVDNGSEAKRSISESRALGPEKPLQQFLQYKPSTDDLLCTFQCDPKECHLA